MTTLALAFMIAALVSFIVAAFGITVPRVAINWTAFGLACAVTCWLLIYWIGSHG